MKDQRQKDQKPISFKKPKQIPTQRYKIRLVFGFFIFLIFSASFIKAFYAFRYYLSYSVVYTEGIIEAERVSISSKAYGRLKEVKDEAKRIKEKELVITLDDKAYLFKLKKAEINLRLIQDKNRLAIATKEKKFRFDEKLYQQDLISKSRLEKSKSAYDSVLANSWLTRLKAEAELEEARLKIKETELYSPIDGIIDKILKYPGETVEPNEPILIIVNPENFWIKASIPQHRVQSLQIGQNVEIKPIFSLNKTYFGKVAQIYTIPEKENIQAKITLDESYSDLKPGMSVNVKIFIGQKEEEPL